MFKSGLKAPGSRGRRPEIILCPLLASGEEWAAVLLEDRVNTQTKIVTRADTPVVSSTRRSRRTTLWVQSGSIESHPAWESSSGLFVVFSNEPDASTSRQGVEPIDIEVHASPFAKEQVERLQMTPALIDARLPVRLDGPIVGYRSTLPIPYGHFEPDMYVEAILFGEASLPQTWTLTSSERAYSERARLLQTFS